MATFNPTVPLSFADRNSDRAIMIQNQLAIDNFIDMNHVEFNAPGQGKHAYATLTNHGIQIDALPVISSGLVNNTLNGLQELVVAHKDANGNLFGFDMTTSILGTTGQSQLTNGFIIKWGNATTVNQTVDQLSAFNFTTAFPVACLMLLPCIVYNPGFAIPTPSWLTVEQLEPEGFIVHAAGRTGGTINQTVNFNYIAIGY